MVKMMKVILEKGNNRCLFLAIDHLERPYATIREEKAEEFIDAIDAYQALKEARRYYDFSDAEIIESTEKDYARGLNNEKL